MESRDCHLCSFGCSPLADMGVFAYFWLTSQRFSHGHLIVVISAYLLYTRRGAIKSTAARPCFVAFVPLVALLVIWLVAVLASIQAIQQIVLPLILWLMFLAVLGWAIAKQVSVLIAYLYLAIPVWESGNIVLQWLTVKVVAIGLWLLQVNAFIEGTVVHLPAGAFEVEARCSGLHYLIVAVALSVLYGMLYLKNNRNRLLLIAVAIGMALLTNWLRVFSVVYAGYLTDMQHFLVTHDHYYFGWVLFAIMLVPYLMFARRVERSETSGDSVEQSERVSEPVSGTMYAPRGSLVAFLGCFTALLVSGGTVLAKMPSSVQYDVSVALPAVANGWSLGESAESDWHPYFVGVSAEASGTYSNSKGEVETYFNVYAGQVQGRELIGYQNHIEGLEKWAVGSSRISRVDLDGWSVPWEIREVRLNAASGDQRVLYLWYDVGGKHLVSDFEAKIHYGINVIRGQVNSGVRLASVVCGQDCGDARALLKDWLGAHVPINGDI